MILLRTCLVIYPFCYLQGWLPFQVPNRSSSLTEGAGQPLQLYSPPSEDIETSDSAQVLKFTVAGQIQVTFPSKNPSLGPGSAFIEQHRFPKILRAIETGLVDSGYWEAINMSMYDRVAWMATQRHIPVSIDLLSLHSTTRVLGETLTLTNSHR